MCESFHVIVGEDVLDREPEEEEEGERSSAQRGLDASWRGQTHKDLLSERAVGQHRRSSKLLHPDLEVVDAVELRPSQGTCALGNQERDDVGDDGCCRHVGRQNEDEVASR